MKNEQLVLFEGNEVKVRTEEGKTIYNLVNTAKGCGLFRTKGKNKLVRWDDIKKKFSSICSSIESSTPQYVDEINYILEEIESTDDRNSIYISSWLAKRLATECNSQLAHKFKNFLATLDEKRENGELIPNNQMEQLGNIANQMNLVASTMGQIGQAFVGLQEFVQDSIQVKDSQIDNIRELCGMKSANTIQLSKYLKQHLEILFKRKLWATSYEYKEGKQKLFDFFNVVKWEDIPIEKYKEVKSYIDILLIEDIIDNSVKEGVQ